ncbi:MAG: NnrU family protein [Gammaproteobacteria bacterium]
MLEIIAAALFFVGTHLVLANARVRPRLVQRLGEAGFRVAYSALSLAALVWFWYAFRRAPYLELWGPANAFKPLTTLMVLVAFLFAVVGLTTRNPAAIAAESKLQDEDAIRGVLRITRHPFLWGVAIWALAHLMVNGDVAAVIFFTGLLLLSLIGTVGIDNKRRLKHGDDWVRFARATSNIPFLAIAQGRNQFQIREIGWWRPLLAVVVWVLFLHLHTRLFGVSPLVS